MPRVKIKGFKLKKSKKIDNPKLSNDAFELFKEWDKERKNLSVLMKKNLNVVGDYIKLYQVCEKYNSFLITNKEGLEKNNVDINPMINQLKTDMDFLKTNIVLLKGEIKLDKSKTLEDKSKEERK